MPAFNLSHFRGVILDAASLGGDIDLSPITNTSSDWTVHATTTAEETIARLQNCQVAVTNKVVIDAQVMAKCPELKLICVAATGTNNIDLDAAEKLGIQVKNAEGYSTESVAQHSISLMLALAGQMQRYQNDLRQGLWSQSPFFCLLDHPINELSGKTLGIIGAGNTGLATARIAKALGMTVLLSQRPHTDSCPADRTPFHTLLENSDVISLHCPLSDSTQHLIGAPELQKMKASSLLINCARGGIVDESALLQALHSNVIAGAALDVLEQEPPAENHPLLHYAQQHHNLLLTPHIAWASVKSRQRLVAIVAKNIHTFTAAANPCAN
jgi:glycerate dehydrogenase